jgi:hypothetical protein
MRNKPLQVAILAVLVLVLNCSIALAAETGPTGIACPTPRVPYGISTECARAISEEAVANAALLPSQPEPAPRLDCPTPRVPYGISVACVPELSNR